MRESVRQTLTGGRTVIALLLVALAVQPFIFPMQRMENFIELFMYASLVLSWNLLSYTGYLNFGHLAFFGTGAYVVGLGITVFNLPIFVTVFLAGVVSGLVGFGLGTVTLRVRGHYFAIASLMLLFIMTTIFTNVGDLVQGASQEIYINLLPSLSITEFRSIFYYIFLAYAVVLAGFSVYLENSKYGYAMRAIGGDEDLALSLGVNTTWVKYIAITISTFAAGVIGGTHALYIQYIDPLVVFPVSLNFLVVFMAFIGGVAVWTGPIVGAVLFVTADELSRTYLSPEFAQLLFGAIFVFVILFRPDGLTSAFREWVEKARRSEFARRPPLDWVLER